MSAAIIGIGLHRFGRTPERSSRQQAAVALRGALADAGLNWSDMQFMIGGSRDAGRIDGLARHFGYQGAPLINIFNGCATAGSALSLASGLIDSGQFEIGAVVGFDKHERGAFGFDPSQYGLPDWYGPLGFAVTAQFFALRIQRYMAEHGTRPETLARVASKAFDAGARNPNAWRRERISTEEVMASPIVCDPLRKAMFCSPSEGAAAVIVCNETVARRFQQHAIRLAGIALRGKRYGSFEIFQTSLPANLGEPVTSVAARQAYEQAGLGPEDVDIAQVQDTDSGAEIIHMAETGLCEPGQQDELLAGHETAMNGRLPINTDGGCLANGEPIGASGLRQIYEVCLQLRGQAGDRQVPNRPRTGLTHVYGAPGISVVTVLQKL